MAAIAENVLNSTTEMYRATGYNSPWIGYLAIEDAECAGTCAFKSAPVSGRIEIAYFTFPGNEGIGVATRMAKILISIAKCEDQEIRICAQTLPDRNASTRLLEKLGFQIIAVVEHPDDGTVWEWELMDKD